MRTRWLRAPSAASALIRFWAGCFPSARPNSCMRCVRFTRPTASVTLKAFSLTQQHFKMVLFVGSIPASTRRANSFPSFAMHLTRV